MGSRANFETATYDRKLDGSEYNAYLAFIVKSHLPRIFVKLAVLLRIFLSLPVSNASCERAMSVLKRVKNDLRANMQQHRLSYLILVSVENEAITSLNIDALITTFDEIKCRRGARFYNACFMRNCDYLYRSIHSEPCKYLSRWHRV